MSLFHHTASSASVPLRQQTTLQHRPAAAPPQPPVTSVTLRNGPPTPTNVAMTAAASAAGFPATTATTSPAAAVMASSSLSVVAHQRSSGGRVSPVTVDGVDAAGSSADVDGDEDVKALSDDEPDFDSKPRRPLDLDIRTSQPLDQSAMASYYATPAPPLDITPDQVIGNVARLAKTHGGSRYLQQLLDTRDPVIFDACFREMKENLVDLSCDHFAHFAVEKLMSLCNEDQILTLLTTYGNSLGQVACQKHGSFAVQALVDRLSTPEHYATLAQTLQDDIVRVMTHPSGHFVILRVLERFPVPATKFIDDAIEHSCQIIGNDHHGLRIIKALLALRRPRDLTRVFKAISRNTLKLVEHQYGNYCIQCVLEAAPAAVRTNIKVKMEGKYLRLSRQKFSSNVVEKCLRLSSAHWRVIIIRELIAQPGVADLLRDRYGNYVLQTCLAVAAPQQVEEIARAIAPHLGSLRENVRAKWKRLIATRAAEVGCVLPPSLIPWTSP